MAFYPKEFFGSIWLTNENGEAISGWPQAVSGIAFGSPLIFVYNNLLLTAFVTQAGELTVHDEGGRLLQFFPMELDGIFYVQPVFDNEFLWLIASNGTLFRIGLDGAMHDYRIPNLQVMEEGHIVLFDIDNDRKPEIFITGEGNALHSYRGNFLPVNGFPLPVWGKPAFVNPGNTGIIDLAGVGMDNRLYLWQIR
jgi:hypothetical protein